MKGVNYLKAHQPLLTDKRFKYAEHLTFAGQARPFHAIDEMEHLIGGMDGLLPYSKEIDRCATEGGMFQAIKYCHPKYMASLKKVLELLYCDDLNGKDYLIYPPQYPWQITDADREMTEERLRTIYAKYVSILTDRAVAVDYQSVENGG